MTPREALIEVMKHFDALFYEGQESAVANMEKLQKVLSDAQKVVDATEDEDDVPCPDCDPEFPGVMPCAVCHLGGAGHCFDTCQLDKVGGGDCPFCPTCHGTRFVKREVVK